MLRHVTRVIGAAAVSEDVVFVREHEGGLWVVVLDGAGGMGGGLHAAQLAATLLDATPPVPTPGALASRLSDVDAALDRDRRAGETTAVVAWVSATHIVGASAGDSSLVLLAEDAELDLTAHQHLKRRLGSGRALPVCFSASVSAPFRLLAGTDGLFHHTAEGAWVAAARMPDLDVAADRLLSLPRMKSGGYPDDVGFALVGMGTLHSRSGTSPSAPVDAC